MANDFSKLHLKIEYLPIDSLKPYERNAKEHPAEQVEQIKRSIADSGMNDPIGIWGAENTVVEGHGRLMACKELGYETVPVIRLDHLTDEQRREYALIHNQTTMNSGWDLPVLDAEIADLPDFDAEFYGFELPELDIDDDPHDDDFDPEIPADPKAKVGDIYALGPHRLMCGDSTDPAVVDRLMDGVKADMLFTSPPYSDMREYNGGKDLSVSNVSNFISAYRPYVDYQCVNLGIQRKNHEIVQYWDEYIAKAKECGYKFLAWNVWNKMDCGSIGQHTAFIPICHEWIFVFGAEFFDINKTWDKKEENIREETTKCTQRQKDGTVTRRTHGDMSDAKKKMESVLSLLPEKHNSIRQLHPATFPVQLPAEYIKAMTNEGDSVIEPFGGSGSTLIACEQLNRKCYMMELDPKYVDVIIDRWETYTGKKAVLLNGKAGL